MQTLELGLLASWQKWGDGLRGLDAHKLLALRKRTVCVTFRNIFLVVHISNSYVGDQKKKNERQLGNLEKQTYSMAHKLPNRIS